MVECKFMLLFAINGFIFQKFEWDNHSFTDDDGVKKIENLTASIIVTAVVVKDSL